MLRRSLLVLAAGSLAGVAAGCGAHGPKPYTAAATAPCLPTKGFTHVSTDSAKIGFIAGFAENGGLRATAKSGNVLTIAFAADDSAGVTSTEQAFRRFAPAKLRPRMNDIMESQGNAVFVWTVSPTPVELDDVKSCLSS
jgi:hypothetical protein